MSRSRHCASTGSHQKLQKRRDVVRSIEKGTAAATAYPCALSNLEEEAAESWAEGEERSQQEEVRERSGRRICQRERYELAQSKDERVKAVNELTEVSEEAGEEVGSTWRDAVGGADSNEGELNISFPFVPSQPRAPPEH